MMIFLFAFLVFNQLLIINIKTRLGIAGDLSKEINSIFYPENKEAATSLDIKLTGAIQEDAKKIIMIRGIPNIYGIKLNVSFDKVQESIDMMKKYDSGVNTLSKAENARYLSITGKISCEFCCTVETLTTKDGSPTCDCDHAKALRGLASYLIKNHGNEFNDDEILRELARWKSVYFPREMIGKLIRQIESRAYSADINALLMGIQLPQYDSKNNDKKNIENIPDMVGGC